MYLYSLLSRWFLIASFAALGACFPSPAQPPAGKPARDGWKAIEPYFQPSAAFTGKLGSYRSPLLFADGSAVKSAADWPRRRKEILDTWNDLMGPWPNVIEKPKVEVLAKSRRENFTQYRVRIEIAPEQTGEGWLLVPDGMGPFPAAPGVFDE